MRIRTALATGLLLLATLAIGGCDGGRKAPPKTRVQVVHAAPTFPAFDFRREQRTEVQELPYSAASAVMAFDVDQYDFSVLHASPGVNQPAQRTFAAALEPDVEYTIVVAEVGGLLEPVILETPVVAGDAQVSALHAGTTLPPVDIYLEPPGTDLTTATPLAELAFLQSVGPIARAGGDYKVTVTEAGNPTAVLLESNEFPLAAPGRAVLVVVDGAGEGTAPLKVVLARDSPATLVDVNLGGAIRVVNGLADQAPRDFAIDEQFSPPALPNVEFGTVSPYVAVPAGSRSAEVTPAGNPGVVELTETVSVAQGQTYTFVTAGPAGSLDGRFFPDDHRRLSDRAKLALLNAATQFDDGLDFRIVEQGGDLANAGLVATLGAPDAAQYIALAPGSYDLHVLTIDVQTVATVPITVEAGGIYGVLVLNGPDATSASTVLFDDFVP